MSFDDMAPESLLALDLGTLAPDELLQAMNRAEAVFEAMDASVPDEDEDAYEDHLSLMEELDSLMEDIRDLL